MAFHEPLRRQFLQQMSQAAPAPDKLLGPVASYGVRLAAANAGPGSARWRLVGIHHLTPDENRGGHQVFVDVVDEQGQRIPLGQAQVQWGWEGQRPDEASPARALDKPANEPAAVIDLFSGQHVWVEVGGQGLPSDRVTNLHTHHADELGPHGEIWNSIGHHSFYLLFQRSRAQDETAGPAAPAAQAKPPKRAKPAKPARPPKPAQPAEPVLHVLTFGPASNQDIINAFAHAAGQLRLADPWALLTKAGMRVETLAANRWARYAGPPLHELSGLNVAEKNLLMQQLAHVLATMPVPPVDTPAAPPPAPDTSTSGAPALPSPKPRKGNRLGFYLHVSIDQNGLWEAIRQVQPPVILVHADTVNRMLLREIRAFRAPNAFVVGRLYKDNDTQRRLLTVGDPSAAGRAMAEEILALDFGLATERGANGRPLIDGWMSLNEAVPGPASRQFAERPAETAALLRAYDLLQTAFHRRLQEAGVEAVAFNFGAGNFTRPEHYLDHFPHTLAAYTYLGFHEYGWPSLYPAPGSATSAGLYRTCMAGIRERFGPRHRAIITEAGLTRMFQDASAGDVGWLNPDRPLSQDEYWQTLDWYNQYLLADDYVVGACLYEVGHHGDWASFRHLGSDNAGQPLHLVERIAALNQGTRGTRRGVQGRGAAAPTPQPPAPTARPRSTPTAPARRGVRGLGGFVRVQGDDFVVDGRVLRFVGVNIRGLVHYGDPRTLPHATRDDAREQIRAARAMGARVIRVFLPSVHADTPATIERLRATIGLLKEEAPDAYLLPALCNFYRDVEFRIPGDDGFYGRIDPNFPGDLLTAAFFQGGYRANYLPFVQQVVQAFRDEPAILAWEIGNELKLNPVGGDLDNDPNIATFLDFMHTTAQEIRRLDPNHLVTTGMISTHHAWLHTPNLRRRLYGGPSFDFLTVHCYNDERENDDSGLARELGKPFLVEEAGYGLSFGGDRSPKVREDMAFWFDRGARGYMPWGFMATNRDIGDGDRDSGLDRTLHHDWEPLFNALRQRAGDLAQSVANLRPTITPATTAAATTGATSTGFTTGVGSGFQIGQTVFSTDWLNMRRSPGHAGKLGDDILGLLAPGTAAVIQAGPQQKDGLVWWLVQATPSGGQPTSGWVAEATSALRLLTAAKPRTVARRAGPQPRGRGLARARSRGAGDVTTLFAAAYINLRRAPGTVGKPSDDVIGQIPYGAKVERLGGPVSADGLTWWSVRAPLLDNSVATGWAAEKHVDGTPLLVGTPPPAAPATGAGAIHGTPFQPDEALTLLAAAPLRPTASTLASGGVSTTPLLPNSAVRVLAGPELQEGLEWWQLAQASGNGAAGAGWAPLTSAEGVRLLAATTVAQAIRVARPFAGVWPVTQGWGLWPEFYRQFLYDGVPLKGHNGIDFGTPENTPLLAVDDGEVLRVDFEPDGFGHFVLLRHRWGESLYAHLNRVDVAQGAPLALGQSLGLSGNSGGTFGPHLHFGVRVYPYRRTDGWGGFVNPLPFMQLADLPISRGAEARPQPMAPELPGRLRP